MTDLERELDTLFQAPFAEFVGTRNGLAARLKKEGRTRNRLVFGVSLSRVSPPGS